MPPKGTIQVLLEDEWLDVKRGHFKLHIYKDVT